MSNKQCKALVLSLAFFLILSGGMLYYIFENQGYNRENTKKIYSYNLKDYVETSPVIYNSYNDIFSSINVSYINIVNVPDDVKKVFIEREDEIISYIESYYNEIKEKNDDNYIPINTVTSTVKSQINSTVLSIFYELDFGLDSAYFSETTKKYLISFNLDLRTNKIMTNDDLLGKYDYNKDYLASKIFEEDVLVSNNEIVIDKDTNISLTGKEVDKRKNKYINRIKEEFDNIIKVYIENNSLTLAYNKKELNELFFDTDYNDEIIFRYLK